MENRQKMCHGEHVLPSSCIRNVMLLCNTRGAASGAGSTADGKL